MNQIPKLIVKYIIISHNTRSVDAVKNSILRIILLFGIFIGHVNITEGSNHDTDYLLENYTKLEVEIPMRDGVKLFTVIYTPKDNSESYPILYNRTPYNVAPYGEDYGFNFRRGLFPEFLREKFIFVFQDVRGRFMSEGTYQHMAPFIANKNSNSDVDESSDAYDTIDWLIKNLENNNGRAGMWGISYPGYYTSCAAIDAHPALKCVSPQAPISDWFYDDPHHHGAFFLLNMGFFAAMDIPRQSPYQDWLEPYDWKNPDGYDFFMKLGPLSNVKKYFFGDSIAFWNELAKHPNYDQFWQDRNILPHLKDIKPAVLVVGGWYDAEDLYGTFKTYRSIEKNSPNGNNRLVIGPWIHGGWARTDGDYLGNVSFEEKTSLYYRHQIELPFFKYYLKDEGSLDVAEGTLFMTGKNEWREFDQWPPKDVESKKLFFHEEGKLSFSAVKSTEQPFDEFVSDPSKPVPYTEETAFGMTKEYMTDDQRFAARRPDVLVFETDVLDEEVILAGPLMARLKVSTTGTDADWVVKLIDVYPSDAEDNAHTRPGLKMAGYQQMVRSEVIRGRFRNSYEHPEPFKPGKVEDINLELQDVLHCFKKGHKIMIQVQSTWFPLVDRNPQKYVDNIFEALPDDFIKATHKVYHSTKNQSFIEVNLLKE
ncbi:CocE/NonD family hydrolase [Carboxylicivirga caseinilyticus]|uniref:CocE/NonD family hydrolase n=1 Tax=Carboxylicivirga caseinilyticus TaxID=3417572 RepID=UPI003D35032A|nr:CocE/NonD family hydrolase [Marinilabiliaceae bacterium A049]